MGKDMRLDDDPSDGPELVLREAPATIDSPRHGSGGMLTGVLMLGFLVGAVALGFYGRDWWNRGASTDATQAARAAAKAAVPEGFGPVPQLDASDDFVRALIRQLSAETGVGRVAGLGRPGPIVRRLGRQDRGRLQSGQGAEAGGARRASSQTLGTGRTLRVDPASYDRYNALANVVDAIDPDGAARAYRRLRPLMQQAFEELGYVNLSFDDRLARALGRLVDVPVQEGDVMLKATSVTFQYADPELEELSPAQKHMLRMGPHNMRLVQTKLRASSRAPQG